MQLGELTWPDKKSLQDYHKVVMRNSVSFSPKSFQFLLPGHKADRLFKGDTILIQSTELDNDACAPFAKYITQHDRYFPFRAELWLKRDGAIPTRFWFLHRLRRHLPGNISGQSLRAGGATALAEAGVPLHMIQPIGRWSSATFQIYIHRHPVLLAAMLRSSDSC